MALPHKLREANGGVASACASDARPRAANAVRADDAEADLAASIGPMLEAVVRIAGAEAGAIRVYDPHRPDLRHEAWAGLPAPAERGGAGAVEFWCNRCAETGNPGSACARSGLRGSEERFAAIPSGGECRYVNVVPLRSASGPVGTLTLLFAAERTLPADMLPLLRATGELIAVAMENARLTRESLRANLVNERQAMANEVHDSLAQGLTYMRMRMNLLRDAIERDDELRAYKYWGDVDGALTDEHRRLRELITSFRSGMDRQGLSHALAGIAATFLERTGIELEFSDRAPGLRLPPGHEVQVFHIVQEALANVHKHANARRARLTIDHAGDRYEICVEDDGLGMAADTSADERTRSEHYGIAIMRERAQRLGGELTLRSVAGAGTTVRLAFPAHPGR